MIKWILLATVFLFASLNANAQLQGQAKIDSLLKELPKAKQDTNHVKLLANLSFEYFRIDPDTGIEYGEKGVKLAKDIKWKEGLANCYSSLGKNYVAGKSDYPKALEYYNMAFEINTSIGNLEMMIYTLQNIGDIHYTQSKYNEAKKYYTQGLELIKNDEFIIYKANLLKRIAFTYTAQGDFVNALEHHYKALKIYEAEGDTIYFAGELHNIANNYIAQSNYPRALDYLHQALKINEEIGNFRWKANNLLAISLVYSDISEHEKALEYNQQALILFEEMDDQFTIAAVLHNIGANYSDNSEYEKAKDYYLRAMKMNEEMGNLQWLSNNLTSLGNIYLHYLDYSKALEYYERALSISEEIGDKSGIATNLRSIGSFYLTLSQDSIINKSEKKVQMRFNKDINLPKSINYLQRALTLQIETGELKSQYGTLFHLSNAYELKGDYKKAYEAFKEYKALKDSVFSMDKEKEIATLVATREKEVAEKELVIQKLQNIRQRNESYALWGGMAVFAVVLFVIYRQRKQSEKLLLNILPAAIAKRLKAKEHPIADHFESASVVFIDIVGFTSIASEKDSKQIVSSLNIIFTKFDEIAAKHKLEKIKTIGDSYMAVTGVPIPDPDHAKNMAKFAIELKTEMHNYRTEDDTLIQFRIGIECGDVVAGVIGEKKFIYDLWGDTVNTASRMESTGTAEEIQVTERFKLALENEFNFEERGELAIKGKGMMKTYYLKGEK